MEKINFESEISGERKHELKDNEDYLSKQTIDRYNLSKFCENVEGSVRGLDTDVRSNVDFATQIWNEIQDEKKRPDIKGSMWNDDPWYRISKKYDDLMRVLFRVSAYKGSMIKLLAIGYNKAVSFSVQSVKQEVELKNKEIELEKLKVELMATEKRCAFVGELYTKTAGMQVNNEDPRIRMLQEQIQQVMSENMGIKDEFIKFKDIQAAEIQRKTREELMVELEQKKLELEKRKTELVERQDRQDRAVERVQHDERSYDVKPIDEDEEIDDDESDDESVVVGDQENATPQGQEEGNLGHSESQDNESHGSVPLRLEFGNYKEEEDYYNKLIQSEGLIVAGDGEVAPYLGTKEEIIDTLGLTHDMYVGVHGRDIFFGILAERGMSYVFGRDAVCQLLGITWSGVMATITRKKMKKKVLWG